MLEELRVCMWRFHGGVWGGRAYFIKVQGKKLRWRVDDRLSKGRLHGFSCRFCSAIKGRESWGGIALRDEAAGGVVGDRDGGLMTTGQRWKRSDYTNRKGFQAVREVGKKLGNERVRRRWMEKRHADIIQT